MKIKAIFSNEENQLKEIGTFESEYKLRDCCEEPKHIDDVGAYILNIHDDVELQTFGGIGGAFADASAHAIFGLSEDKRKEVIKAYFDRKEGIGYSFGRLSIGSCDFSKDDYTYVKEGDMTLDTFDISHDKEKIFKLVKEAEKYGEIKLFASPWSPPAYMKTNNNRIGGHLKRDCYELWAKHFAKYVDACAENGVKIWGVTIQNEPRHHQIWESCLYSREEESEFLGYLGKELQPKNVKIFCLDHDRERMYERLNYIKNGKNGKYISGVAHHWYSGDHFGEMRAVNAKYPDMINIASESCIPVYQEGILPEAELSTAEAYAHDIIGSFNNGLHYYCDWCIALDEKNGPYHNRVGRGAWMDAIVYCDNSKNEIIYRLGYYYIGHISKYVMPGAKVISTSCWTDELEAVGFKNPDGKIVLVVLNRKDKDGWFIIRIGDEIHKVKNIPKHSIMTFIIEK